MAREGTDKEECFNLWLAGRGGAQILERMKGKVRPKSIRQWVREWERGKRGVWEVGP